MTVIGDIALSIIINLIPLALFGLPIFFLRKKSLTKIIYSRFFYGICFFFLVYWILPALLQFKIKPLSFSAGQDPKPAMVASFLAVRTFSLVISFLQYPFVLLPLIFIISPFVSFLILYLRIRKEPEHDIFHPFEEVQYEYYTSPKQMVKKSLLDRDWSKEWDMFKAFLIVLPIAIYLLAVIVDIAGYDAVNINESETGIGMLIEIFFVYLATFLYGYQLIKASKISFRGKFVGEKIEARFFTSLKQVGTPIAVLSILLFIGQETGSILFFIYLFGYFLMAAFIFVIFLRVFEPISILILLKVINARKNGVIRKRASQRHQDTAPQLKATVETSVSSLRVHHRPHGLPVYVDYIRVFLYALLAGTIVLFIYLGLLPLVDLLERLLGDDPGSILDLAAASASPSYTAALVTEIEITLHSIQVILQILVMAGFFSLALKSRIRHIYAVLIYGGALTLYTFLVAPLIFAGALVYPLGFEGQDSWLTGVPVILDVLQFQFYTIRSGFLTASFSGSSFLSALSVPFTVASAFTNFILWGYLFHYLSRQFRVKSVERTKNYVERITYSFTSPSLPSDITQIFDLYPRLLLRVDYLAEFNAKAYASGILPERAGKSLKNVIQTLEFGSEIYLHDIDANLKKDPDFLRWLAQMLKSGIMSMWVPEFSCIFERAEIDSLYLLYEDGRNLYHYHFHEAYQIKDGGEPAQQGIVGQEQGSQRTRLAPSLISGMFAAITSFVHEATNSADLLRSIDSGDKKVLLEYSDDLPIFAAIFADRENAQVRAALKSFLDRFGDRHREMLVPWSGDISPFAADEALVEEVFEEFL